MQVKVSISPPLSGAENMLVDKQTFDNHESRSQNNSEEFCEIRIYEWSQPTLSFGLAQKKKQVYLKPNLLNNLELVNRVTGGRVVLHHQEITYSVVAPIGSEVFGTTLNSSYQQIAQILVAFLNKLGIKAEPKNRNKIRNKNNKTSKKSSRIKNKSLVCYDLSGFGEIIVAGKKLIGSAQKRGTKYFLQHGSIPFYRHDLKLEDYLLPEYVSNQKVEYIFISDYSDIEIAEAKLLLRDTFLEQIV